MKKSNMYKWITKSWNPINGACPHNCYYCYVQHLQPNVRKLYQGEIHLNDKTMKQNLGKGNFYFVGSCFDIFADITDSGWIWRILTHCVTYPQNAYLFQSKNPLRFKEFSWKLSQIKNYILGITIETNRLSNLAISNAPSVSCRAGAMSKLPGIRKMVSIEPIMDFDLPEMLKLILMCQPEFVSIGADSKGHNLPEPSAEKITGLISELERFTEVRKKDNLERILGGEKNELFRRP